MKPSSRQAPLQGSATRSPALRFVCNKWTVAPHNARFVTISPSQRRTHPRRQADPNQPQPITSNLGLFPHRDALVDEPLWLRCLAISLSCNVDLNSVVVSLWLLRDGCHLMMHLRYVSSSATVNSTRRFWHEAASEKFTWAVKLLDCGR
jgi:hypothetical protein